MQWISSASTSTAKSAASTTPGRAGCTMSMQQLLIAARDDNAEAIRRLVEDLGVDIHSPNPVGQTALHIAAVQGALRAAAALLELGADANNVNRFGQTPLHFAVRAQRNVQAMCELLLEQGAESIPDEQGQVPYELADDDELRALLGGPDPRLFELAKMGDAAGLRALLEQDPDMEVDCFGGGGLAPIHLAAQGGHAEVVRLLLASGNYIDMQSMPRGMSALHWAVERGHAQLVELLVQQGANLNLQNFVSNECSGGSWLSEGETLQPLHQTPLHLAVEGGEADIAGKLLASGADANVMDWDGKTPLALALDMQDDELVELLLDSGADPTKGSKDFVSPLHQAAAGGMERAVSLLLAKQAPVDAADEQGWTELMLAARRGKAAVVRELIAAGADVSRQNAQLNTALHLAAINNKAEVVALLLNAPGGKAAAVLRNAAGQTPAGAARPEATAALQSFSEQSHL